MNPPLAVRLFLMRNQIAIASRSERIFAIQLCVRFSFMGWFAGDKDIGDFFSELFFGEVAVEVAVFAD